MEEFASPVFGDDNWVEGEKEEFKREIDENGVSNIEEFLRKRLEKWREVEVNIAVTGDSGVGKSSFINAIRELCDDDEGAAPVDVTECTAEPTIYDHPSNSNIKFWDLPGIGTPNYPDLETYVQKVQLDKYHAFLILTAARFTENDLLLAKTVKSMEKRFFCIRTKIDENVRAESRKKSFNEEAMLTKIRRNCLKNLSDLLRHEKDVFLISNHEPAKWDFVRLTQAILDALSRYQRETMTLSLGKAITKSSTEIFQRKVDALKCRIWKVAAASAFAALFPMAGLSFGVDAGLILSELRFYRSQLGLPETDSVEFARLPPATKEKVFKAWQISTAGQLSAVLASYSTESGVEEAVRFIIPFFGSVVASGMSYGAACYALHTLLKTVEDAVLSVIREAAEKTAAELESQID